MTDVGLIACLYETRGVLDVSATLERADAKASEVIAGDGYVELRYRNQPGATPEQTTVIVRALSAPAAAQRT